MNIQNLSNASPAIIPKRRLCIGDDAFEDDLREMTETIREGNMELYSNG